MYKKISKKWGINIFIIFKVEGNVIYIYRFMQYMHWFFDYLYLISILGHFLDNDAIP